MKLTSTLIAGVVFVLAATGCETSGADAGQSVPDVMLPPPSAAVTTFAGDRSPESHTTTSVSDQDAVSDPGIVVDTVDQLSDWTVVAGPASELRRGVVLSDSEALVVAHTSTGTAVAVATHSGYDVLHVTNASWLEPEVAMAGDTVVEVATTRSEDRTVIYRLEPGAEPEVLMEWGPEHYPEVAVSGSKLLFTNLRDDGVPCITELDFETQSKEDLICSDIGHLIGWPAATNDELSFVLWTDSDCGELWRMDLDDPESAEPVSGDACVFHGTALGGIAAWVEPPALDERGYVDFFHVPGVVESLSSSAASPSQLGSVAAGSMRYCSDALYWLFQGDAENPSELRRWDPVSGVTVIYRSPDEGLGWQYPTSKPLCSADDRVMLQRASPDVGAPQELLIQGPYPTWFDITEIPIEVAVDPEAFLRQVRTHEQLADWSSQLDDDVLLQNAEQVCTELDAQSPDDRYTFLTDPDTEQRWMGEFDVTDLELWFFRQAATESICPDHYFLTLGG